MRLVALTRRFSFPSVIFRLIQNFCLVRETSLRCFFVYSQIPQVITQKKKLLTFFSGNISRSFCLSSCIFQLKFLILSIAPCSLRARGDNCKLAFHNIMLTLLRPLSYSTSSSPIYQVLIANHLYNAKFTRLSISLHCFNWLQVIRLLATRGHYSIDLIIGYM